MICPPTKNRQFPDENLCLSKACSYWRKCCWCPSTRSSGLCKGWVTLFWGCTAGLVRCGLLFAAHKTRQKFPFRSIKRKDEAWFLPVCPYCSKDCLCTWLPPATPFPSAASPLSCNILPDFSYLHLARSLMGEKWRMTQRHQLKSEITLLIQGKILTVGLKKPWEMKWR